MNLSLIVIEKIKSYFGLSANQFVSLANLARTMEKDDFAFLADIPDGQADNKDLVDKVYSSKYYFSYLANSLPDGGELVWNPEINPDNSLEKKYPEVLENSELNRNNQSFVGKWLKATQDLEFSTVTEPITNIDFLDTSCTPSFYDKIDQPWTKITLNAADLTNLDAAVRSNYPNLIYSQVDPLMNGENLDIQSISFEIQLASIQRNWFNNNLLQNRNWKLNGTDILSNGVDCTEGKLPAYTSSMIFIKNVEWVLTPNSPNNITILKKLQEGTLTLGSLPIQGIPQGANLQNWPIIRSSPLTPLQYRIFNQNIQTRFNSGDLILQTPLETGQVITPTIPLVVHTQPINPVVLVNNTTHYIPAVEVNQVLTVQPPAVQVVHTVPIVTGAVLTHGRWRGADKSGSTSRDPGSVLQVALRNREYYRYYPYVFAEVQPVETTYSVSGYVRTKGSNAPLKDVLVTILCGEGQRLTALTDQNGWYSIAGVRKGSIAINVGKTNYETFEETTQLTGNQTHNVSLAPVAMLPPGTFFLFGVISSRLPQLPNPEPDGEYVEMSEAVEVTT